jgi:hypothetical protein
MRLSDGDDALELAPVGLGAAVVLRHRTRPIASWTLSKNSQNLTWNRAGGLTLARFQVAHEAVSGLTRGSPGGWICGQSRLNQRALFDHRTTATTTHKQLFLLRKHLRCRGLDDSRKDHGKGDGKCLNGRVDHGGLPPRNRRSQPT